MLSADDLPNDIDQLKALIIEQQALIEQLQHQVQQLLRQRYGQRSEKQPSTKAPGQPPANQSAPHGRNHLPDTLLRESITYPVAPDQLACPACGQTRLAIGEEVSEQLEYVPGHLKVIRHRRQKVVCRHCQGELTTAPLPPQPIDRGLPGAGLLAHIIVSKYADHLPLYRQVQQFSRHGVELAPSTLSDWVQCCGQQLLPVVEAMKQDALQAPKLHTDDTPVPVLAKGKTKQGRLWVYLSDCQGHPAIALYDYSPSRAGCYPQTYLANYQGYIQADAFAGYDALYRDGKRIEVACVAHGRRKFEEITKQSKKPGRANEAIAYIKQLYDIERQISAYSNEQRYQHRKQHSQPILNAFKQWLDTQITLPKSPLGQAINYWRNHWQALTNYLLDGCLAIDNNPAERALRPIAVGRNNWLFAGSDKAGKQAAVLYSLIQTCKLNGINAYYYLQDVLKRLPTTKMKEIASLLPYHWQQQQAAINTS